MNHSAASLYYQCRSQMEDAVMLVFDFGGGTLDVSLVECFDNIVEILAVSGDNHLGGSDFDRLIADMFWKSCGLSENRFSAEDAAIVLERAENCKFELTGQETAQMCVTLAGREYRMEVSRKELILQAEPLFERMAQPIRRVLSDGQKSAREVDAVVLVGGSCKMPVVQKYLNYLLQRTDIAVDQPGLYDCARRRSVCRHQGTQCGYSRYASYGYLSVFSRRVPIQRSRSEP